MQVSTFLATITSFEYVYTNVLDYSTILLANGLMYNHLFQDGSGIDIPKVSVMLLFALFTIHLREKINFFVLGDRIAKAKRNHQLWNPWLVYYIFQNVTLTILYFKLFGSFGFFETSPIQLTWASYSNVMFSFYALRVLNDIFSLMPFHGLMHSKYMRYFHDIHHEVNTNAQSIMALHIGIIDCGLENFTAPLILFAVQYLLGFEMRVHLFSAVLSTFITYINHHSVNPHSVVLWNPVLDYVFKCNVAHQLHHSLNMDYTTFVPYHHVFSSLRTKDMEIYNKIMKTTFLI